MEKPDPYSDWVLFQTRDERRESAAAPDRGTFTAWSSFDKGAGTDLEVGASISGLEVGKPGALRNFITTLPVEPSAWECGGLAPLPPGFD
jgi:hypothetical protein